MATVNVKIVVVGDAEVGKTALIVKYVNDAFPTAYVPTVFDNYTETTDVEGVSINGAIWDCAGSEEYSRLRVLSYPETDVFIVVYSVVSRRSFDHIEPLWLPEVTKRVPTAKTLLVGTKTDLRESGTVAAEETVTTEEGKNLAVRLKFFGFIECSALNKENVKETFMEAYSIHFHGVRCPPKPAAPLIPTKGPEVVGQDLAAYLLDGAADAAFPTDVVIRIRSNDGGSDALFPAHKMILGCASPLLASVLGITFTGKKKKRLSSKIETEVKVEASEDGAEVRVEASSKGALHLVWERVMRLIYSGDETRRSNDNEPEKEKGDRSEGAEKERDAEEVKLLRDVLRVLQLDDVADTCDLWLESPAMQESPLKLRRSLTVPEILWARMGTSHKKGEEPMGPFCDIAIVVEGGGKKKVHAHRVILAARSKHFGALFHSGMKDATSAEVEMEGVGLESIRGFLSWVYTGRVQLQAVEDWMELLMLADQWNEVDLINLCEQAMSELLAVGNVFAITEWAEKVNAEHLLEYCHWWMAVNFEECANTKGFKELPKEVRNQIVKNQWPPEEYRERTKKSKDNKRCILQ